MALNIKFDCRGRTTDDTVVILEVQMLIGHRGMDVFLSPGDVGDGAVVLNERGHKKLYLAP